MKHICFAVILLLNLTIVYGISGSLNPQQEELFSLANGASFYVKAIGVNGDTCDYQITFSGYERETDNLNSGCSFIYKYAGGKAILTHNGVTGKCQFSLLEYGGTADKWETVCNEDCSECVNECPCEEEVIDCNECEYTGYDCSSNTLYYCSYSGDCIVRNLVDVCGGEEYCDVSSGTCKSVSKPDCPYECCKNINAYSDKLCSTGYSCTNNQCVKDCQPMYEKNCYNGDVYWYDSCGDRETRFQVCQKCSDGKCISSVISHTDKRCYNDDVYWYDNEGNREELYEKCSANEKCADGSCRLYSSSCPYECCLDTEGYYDKSCPTGKACVDNKCIIVKKTCPYECCEDMKYYKDKICSDGECVGNKCVEDAPEIVESTPDIDSWKNPNSQINRFNSNPIILVHGWTGDREAFEEMDSRLSDEGFLVYRFTTYDYISATCAGVDYTYKNNTKIEVHSEKLRQNINQVLAETGARKVDIVAHSMGGLISRYYIEKLDGFDNVNRLIMLGTPNHGSILTGPLSEAIANAVMGSYDCNSIPCKAPCPPDPSVEQIANPDNEFLNELNKARESIANVDYYTVRGESVYRPLEKIWTDTIVPSESVRLKGSSGDKVVKCGHLDLRIPSECPEAYNYILTVLEAPPEEIEPAPKSSWLPKIYDVNATDEQVWGFATFVVRLISWFG